MVARIEVWLSDTKVTHNTTAMINTCNQRRCFCQELSKMNKNAGKIESELFTCRNNSKYASINSTAPGQYALYGPIIMAEKTPKPTDSRNQRASAFSDHPPGC